jgi:intracellular septation protein A
MIRLFSAFKPILSDFLSTIVFIAFMEASGNLILSVAAGMVTGAVQIAVLKLRGGRIEVMQWASFVLVIVLGSASILTANPMFAMLKPGIGNFAIGLVMLTPNWMGRYLPAMVTENVSRGAIVAWGYVWSAAEIGLAVANTYVVLELGKAAWMQFSVAVPLPLQLGLFLVQYAWLRAAVIRSMKARAQPA